MLMVNVIRILLVEDDEDDFLITRDLLAELPDRQFNLIWQPTYELGLEALQRDSYDVALVDYRLGAHTGVELLLEVKRLKISTTIVLLTGEKTQEADIAAMQAGAADYLVKGQITAQLLGRSIRYAMAHAETLRALGKAEAQYRQLFESSSQGIFRSGPGGELLLANPAMATICGFASVAELLRYSKNDLYDHFYVESERRRLFQQLLDQQPELRGFESQIYRHDGSVRWIRENARAVRDGQGALQYYEGSIQDITEEKKIEQEHALLMVAEAAREEAQSSERRFAFLAESSNRLGKTLDYEQLLKELPEVVIPFLADWCTVHVVEPSGALRRFKTDYRDAGVKKIADAARQETGQSDLTSYHPYLHQLLADGQAKLTVHVNDTWYAKMSVTPEQEQVLRLLRPTSSIIVPLIAHDRQIGLLSLARQSGSAPYTKLDLALAEELAQRAALALDNALLYQRAQNEVRERQQAEVEQARLLVQLSAEEARLQAVLQQMPAGVIIADASSGRIILGNPQVEEVLGHSISNFDRGDSPRTWHALHLNGTKLEHDEWPLVRATQRGEVVIGEELEYVHGDGSPRFLSISAAPIRNAKGAIEAAVVTFYDITRRRQDERELAKSFNVLNAVIQSTTDIVFVKGLDGKYLMVNPATARVLGQTPNDILGKADHDFYTQEFLEKILATDRHVYTTGQEQIIEERIQTTNGIRTFLSTKTPYRDSDGRIIGLIGVCHDITERKLLEEQKDEFLGIASHELKTPLTSIKAFTQILQRRMTLLKDEEAMRYLDKMDHQMNNLTQLINTFLDVTRVQSGKLVYHCKLFDLDQLVDEVVDDVQHATDRHTLVVDGVIGNSVMGDRDRIAQVLLNLLTNALKYSPQADRVVLSRGTCEGNACVWIRDFGLGIAADDLEHIFDRFYRSDGGNSTIAGLGLGLYISAEIVKRHHGRLSAVSTVGEGSTFCLALPISKSGVH
jgi:PAS domain S-box-containing protein